jgi:hypothetical protein
MFRQSRTVELWMASQDFRRRYGFPENYCVRRAGIFARPSTDKKPGFPPQSSLQQTEDGAVVIVPAAQRYSVEGPVGGLHHP